MIRVYKNFEKVPTILNSDNRKEAFDKNIQSKDYIDKSNLYKVTSVQNELAKIYHFKCGYCEKDIKDEDIHIEHYRPKSRYYWLAYSWDNLLFSCGQCNRPKGKKFLTKKCSNLYAKEPFDDIHTLGFKYDKEESPMIINPEKDDVLDDIVFDKNAKISSHNERVQYTIDKACNLNRNGLVENRIKLFNALKRRVVKHIYNKDIIGLESEIENFIEECTIKSEYYAFRYFILKHVTLFFENRTIQKVVLKVIDKNIQTI